jgi:hypothetical protein
VVGRHRPPILPFLVAVSVGACSTGAATPTTTDLSVTTRAQVGSAEPIGFEVPEDAVAISILARGVDPATLIQLEALELGGRDVIGGRADDADRMSTRHAEHEIIETDTGFVHEVQQGTFAFSYPLAAEWELPFGPASVSFLVGGSATIDVEVVVLRIADRRVLPVTVFTPGGSRLSTEVRDRVSAIYEPAGIVLRWEDGFLPAETPASLVDVEDRLPGSDLHALAAAVAARSTGGANVAVVDGLPHGISGLSTSIPGPHDGTGMAVTVTFRSQAETARLVAHEIGHLLGLRHLEDRSSRGVVVRNPIVDTRSDAYNLMQFGSNLTEGQIAVLRLSPLLGAGP